VSKYEVAGVQRERGKPAVAILTTSGNYVGTDFIGDPGGKRLQASSPIGSKNAVVELARSAIISPPHRIWPAFRSVWRTSRRWPA